jgi:ketol-acid reductoisomerase
MARVYYDSDADLGVLKGRTVAIVGYGNQGRAQALNIRDSGVKVIVGGLRDATLERAVEDGFPAMSVKEAAAAGDIICLLIPDEVQRQVYQEEVAPVLTSGKALNFAHGYNIQYGFIAPAPQYDVIMVAPRMIGVGVRDNYVAGKGVPAFVAVQQDGSGQAWPRTLALAKAIGSTRTGAIESTFAEETELDHFSEHFVWPALFRILVGSFDFLTASGYQPEAVLIELWGSGEASEVLARMAEVGIFQQMDFHSLTSQFGTLTHMESALPSTLREHMAEALKEIKDGSFARRWEEERAQGYPVFTKLKQAAHQHPVNELEEQTRKLVSG